MTSSMLEQRETSHLWSLMSFSLFRTYSSYTILQEVESWVMCPYSRITVGAEQNKDYYRWLESKILVLVLISRRQNLLESSWLYQERDLLKAPFPPRHSISTTVPSHVYAAGHSKAATSSALQQRPPSTVLDHHRPAARPRAQSRFILWLTADIYRKRVEVQVARWAT